MEEQQFITDEIVSQIEVSDNSAVILPETNSQIMPASFELTTNLAQGIAQDIHALLVEMADLQRDFETKVKYDESKERLIESLHRELQEYREGLHFRILKPIFIDLIALYDDLGKLIESIARDDNPFSERMAQNLVLFREAIEETLSRNDVNAFVTEENLFLSSKQRILRVNDTDDPTLDRHIAKRVRKGFECGGRVLRPEIVEIYKYISTYDQ